jgi:hypothetical protein
VEAELEGHTVVRALLVRGRVSGAREKRHRHGGVCRGNNETASVHKTWVRAGCVGRDDGEQVGGAVSEVSEDLPVGGRAHRHIYNGTASESRDCHEVSRADCRVVENVRPVTLAVIFNIHVHVSCPIVCLPLSVLNIFQGSPELHLDV